MLVTPIKNLTTNIKQSSIAIIDPKQQSVPNQITSTNLPLKQKRIQTLQQKINEQSDKIQQLQQKLIDKEIALTNKNENIQILTTKISDLQNQLSKFVGKMQGKNRQLYKMDIQILRDRQQNIYHDKISKMLTKQNHQLITEKATLKEMINELIDKIQTKQGQIQSQVKNNKLLTQLNQTLKLQIQQLLFEIRMLHRRQQTAKLSDYQVDVDRRISLIGKYKSSKSKLQDVQEDNQQESQLTKLFKLKITSLQQQLAISQKRCKQLQTIVLSQ